LPASPDVPPDFLGGLFRRLVDNLSSLDPGAVRRPVRVAEIHERLVPYRTHRALLGFDTSEDYEMTILRLLAGERGLAQVFPADVAAVLVREAASVNPDTGIFRQFPDATVLLDPEAASQAPTNGEQAKPVTPAVAGSADLPSPVDIERESALLAADAGDADADDDADALPFALDDAEESHVMARPRDVTASAACNYCGGALPVGRTVLFCPHCGQNIGVVHCSTCGSELDVGWGFCITCGQKLKGLG
jgi:hypothetical protein